MRLQSGKSSSDFVLEFDAVEEYEQFFEQAEQTGHFYLRDVQLPDKAVFVARAVGSPRSRRIRPVEIARNGEGYQVWIVSRPKAEASVQIKESPLDRVVANGDRPKSFKERIRSMPMTERVALAMKGDLHERRELMQENNVKIHEFLLRNPRITESEIAWMARNPASPIQTILTILQHKGWMGMDLIRTGILTNPKTPAAIVLDMIPLLSAGDLIKMHHAKHLREDVKDSVQREIKKRNIRIKHTE